MPDQLAADATYYRGVLQELVELGMVLARRIAAPPVGEVAGEEAAGEPAGETAAAFERVSRAVRRTVRLAQFLASVEPGPVQPVLAREQNRVDARKRIVRRLEDHLEWASHVGLGGEGLHEELLERLDAPDVLEDIDRGRPVAEIIEEIRCDLGLKGTDQHRRRRPAEVAALCAWAAAPREMAIVPAGVSSSRPGRFPRGRDGVEFGSLTESARGAASVECLRCVGADTS